MLRALVATLALVACQDDGTVGPTARLERDSRMAWVPLASACDDGAAATPLPSAARDSLPPRPAHHWTSDDEWADLATRVPGGWGGNWVSGDTLVVMLVDPTRLDEALAVLAAEGFPARATTVARRARWDFAQLHDWYRYVQFRLAAPSGIVMSHIDETENRLEYGFVSQEAREAFEARLLALGAPCRLVATAVVAPIVIAR